MLLLRPSPLPPPTPPPPKGNTERQFVPTLIEALGGVRVYAMSAGANHSLFLAENGKVYSCGYGGNGMLGHGNTEDQLVPKLIEALPPVA
eukprot:g2025.t1